MPTCPNCSHTFTTAKPRKAAELETVDTSTLSDSEVHAYYKRIAPAEDLRFFLGLNLSPALRARAESVSRPNAKDIQILRMSWRAERAALDLALGRWHLADPAETAAELVTSDPVMLADALANTEELGNL